MKTPHLLHRVTHFSLFVCALTSAAAFAQNAAPPLAQMLPPKPLQIVVANAAGGPDNITVILVRLLPE